MKGYITANGKSEGAMLKELQGLMGSEQDGSIGPAAVTDIAIKMGVKGAWPVTTKMYGYTVILAKDITPFTPGGKKAAKDYANCITGSFTYPRAKAPCSILVSNGQTVYRSSCHRWTQSPALPESVIYRLRDGSIGIKRCFDAADDLPKDVKWAVGGMGLLDMYDPAAEGFKGAYSDMLRSTYHNILGVKGDMLFLMLSPAATAAQINAALKNNFKLDMAILLDGGGLASINGDWAQYNIKTPQGYIIQAIKA